MNKQSIINAVVAVILIGIVAFQVNLSKRIDQLEHDTTANFESQIRFNNTTNSSLEKVNKSFDQIIRILK